MRHDAQVATNLKRLVSSEAYQSLRAFFIAKIPPVPAGGWVLDVGCGEGSLSREIAETLGPDGKVIGLDISADLLELARETTSRSNVEYVKRTATALEFDDELFDIVLSCNALKFLTPLDLSKAMSEMIRVLKPGGTLLIADSDDRAITFNATNVDLGEMIVSAYSRLGDPYFGRKLIGLCRLSGLEDLRVDAITVFETEFDESSAGRVMADNICQELQKTREPDFRIRTFSEEETSEWYRDLMDQDKAGAYFWSYTKYVCVGKKRLS
jgi:ubiquinone/menaquinone biosynthesis C-methylase UbiE